LLNFVSTLEEEFKTLMLLTLTTSSTTRYHFQKKLYDTSFTTNDQPNAIKGVGVLANCQSTVIKSGIVIWLDCNFLTSCEIFKSNGSPNATLCIERSRLGNLMMRFKKD
jgi:hypothetical protein